MKPHPFLVLPACGPIHLEIDVPPTANRCGVRYDVHLDAEQSDEVRAAAKLLGMPLGRFVQSALNEELPVTIGFMPDVALTPLAQAVERSIKRLRPDLRNRINERAAYHGYATPHAYLCALLNSLHGQDVVVHPHTGQSVGTDRYWERIRKLLGVDHPRWTTDPLDHPGFLDRFPNRDPWAAPVKPLPIELYDDDRLKAAKVAFAIAA